MRTRHPALGAVCAILLAFACAAGLAACGQVGGTGEPAASQAAQTVTVTQQVGDGEAAQVSVAEGASVLDVLEASGVPFRTEESSFGAYVVAIDGTEAAASSGWTYSVNGEEPDVGAGSYQVKAGDAIAWAYVTYK